MEGVSGVIRSVLGWSPGGISTWWWMSTYPSSNSFKRLVTLLVLLLTLVWMLRKVRRVRQRQQATLNRGPPSTTTASHHSSSSSSSSASSLSSSSSTTTPNATSLISSPIRSVHVLDTRQLQQDAKLSPQLKYLSHSSYKRPAVITTSVFLNWSRTPIPLSSSISPSPSTSSTSSSSSSSSSSSWSCSVLSDDILAIMHQLAANTTLYILHCEHRSPNQPQQDQHSAAPPSSAIVRTLVETGIFEAGLAKHRVLYCWNESGLSAMVRQLQPQLFVDDNVTIARSLCAYVQDCVVVERSSSSSSALSSSSSSPSSVSTVAVSAAATPSTLTNIGRQVPMFYVSASLLHFFRYQGKTA